MATTARFTAAIIVTAAAAAIMATGTTRATDPAGSAITVRIPFGDDVAVIIHARRYQTAAMVPGTTIMAPTIMTPGIAWRTGIAWRAWITWVVGIARVVGIAWIMRIGGIAIMPAAAAAIMAAGTTGAAWAAPAFVGIATKPEETGYGRALHQIPFISIAKD